MDLEEETEADCLNEQILEILFWGRYKSQASEAVEQRLVRYV
jgi:hypothetical protein